LYLVGNASISKGIFHAQIWFKLLTYYCLYKTHVTPSIRGLPFIITLMLLIRGSWAFGLAESDVRFSLYENESTQFG